MASQKLWKKHLWARLGSMMFQASALCTVLKFATTWSLQLRLFIAVVSVLQIDRFMEYVKKEVAKADTVLSKSCDRTSIPKESTSNPGRKGKKNRLKKKGL